MGAQAEGSSVNLTIELGNNLAFVTLFLGVMYGVVYGARRR